MRTCSVRDVLRLVRAHNLVVAAAGVLAGGWIALGAIATPKLLVFAAAAAVAFGAAGNAVNDIWDTDADRVNRRPGERPLAGGRPAAGLVPWALAAWLHLVREIVKDLGDEPGDRLVGRRTLPVVIGARATALLAAGLGVGFVPASLALPFAARYGAAYYLIALFAQPAVLLVASRLIAGKRERNTLLLKGAMVVGIVALVAGRIA